MKFREFCIWLIVLGTVLSAHSTSFSQSPDIPSNSLSSTNNRNKLKLVQIQTDSGKRVGSVLGWDGKQIVFLRRNGAFDLIPATKPDIGKVVAPEFRPYDSKELKRRLKKEFGKRYNVSTTKRFVVVHPWGKPNYWALPFEEFYRGFEKYAASSGFELSSPKFPLVAIVLRSRSDFDRYLHNAGESYSPNVLGFYSRQSNRMVIYDPSAKLRTESESWLYQSPTIVHETAHQLAFNRGIHNRFAPPPLWLSEGLAMLFEAPGVHNSEKFPDRISRVNRRRLGQLRKLYDQMQVKTNLPQLIPNDDLFRNQPEIAYPISWGLAFYLSEKMPDEWAKLLAHDGNRKSFKKYTPSERATDFMNIVSNDFGKLANDMEKFLYPADERPSPKEPENDY